MSKQEVASSRRRIDKAKREVAKAIAEVDRALEDYWDTRTYWLYDQDLTEPEEEVFI